MVTIFIRPTSLFHGKGQINKIKYINENRKTNQEPPSKDQLIQKRKVSHAVPSSQKMVLPIFPVSLGSKLHWASSHLAYYQPASFICA